MAAADPAGVLLMGGANSGMTTLMEQLRMRARGQCIPGRCVQGLHPTVGVNKHRVAIDGSPVLVTEVGGKMAVHNHRQLAPGGFAAVVYVIDASQPAGLAQSVVELQHVLAHEQVATRRIPVLVVLNKQDAPSVLSRAALDTFIGPATAGYPSPVSVTEASGATGRGAREILDWLAGRLRGPRPPS
eukprot:TRINITY_DN61770_c0_g1_i1.p2 TRINITY_DN61770_c0_g1~~TRINITY_DN61770_c0_g1_i1.p2  ORF type:complete len:186 (+),score=43.66 TRINITY_DN61770_c0_g1_i1:77-634(+)